MDDVRLLPVLWRPLILILEKLLLFLDSIGCNIYLQNTFLAGKNAERSRCFLYKTNLFQWVSMPFCGGHAINKSAKVAEVVQNGSRDIGGEYQMTSYCSFTFKIQPALKSTAGGPLFIQDDALQEITPECLVCFKFLQVVTARSFKQISAGGDIKTRVIQILFRL